MTDHTDYANVVREVIRWALDDYPALLPQDRRYADDAAQRIAKDHVAREIALTLARNGFLPPGDALDMSAPVLQAVSFTMGQMRTRLLKHLRGGGRDAQAEREAHLAIARSFFDDLERQGWRLVRTSLPVQPHSTRC